MSPLWYSHIGGSIIVSDDGVVKTVSDKDMMDSILPLLHAYRDTKDESLVSAIRMLLRDE